MATTKTNTPVATPDMLNAIRSESSAVYQDRVPLATPYNLQEVGNPILEYEAMANEFLDTLMNKIVLQLIVRRMFNNPLSDLRRSEMPLGMDVEETHVNPAKAVQYDGTETGMADLLKMHKPDVASVYYRLNRQDKYPVTINNDQLRGAFTSWNKMEDLIGAITDSLYNGSYIDEFKYTKQLVSDAIAANRIIMRVTPAITNEATGKRFMSLVRELSTMFTFPSTTFNSYAAISGKPPRTTWCPIDQQIILTTGAVAASVGVEVLSAAFNLNYADYVARNIIVDSFDDPDVMAVMADRRAFMIMGQLNKFTTFYNASALNWQYFYHVWDLFSLSPFHNMVAIKKE